MLGSSSVGVARPRLAREGLTDGTAGNRTCHISRNEDLARRQSPFC